MAVEPTAMVTQQDLYFFLHFGYFPRFRSRMNLDYSGIDPARYHSADEAEILAAGRAAFHETIAQGVARCKGQRIVVPLSGGLDSRAILAGLLDYVPPTQIEAYTFGTPGSYDYEIGAQVARAAGVRHRAIDLTQAHWQRDSLLETARRQAGGQTVLFHHVPLDLLEPYSAETGAVIWSGYIGDAVFGGHRPARGRGAAGEAVARMGYYHKRAEVKSMSLLPEGVDRAALLALIDVEVGAPQAALSWEERILLAEVGKITAPHVLPDGFVYETPFINSALWRWALSLPPSMRCGRRAFIDLMCADYPALFMGLPSKGHWGLRFDAPAVQVFGARALNKLHHMALRSCPGLHLPPSRNVNFIDFGHQLRRCDDLQKIVCDCLHDLRGRKLIDWLDLDGLYKAHMSGQKNVGDALAVLCSLELSLLVRVEGSYA